MQRPHMPIRLAAVVAVVAVVVGTTTVASPVVDPSPSAPGQTYPDPVPAPGFITVEGTISVINTPSVRALQSGVWEVNLAQAAAVVIPSPTFIVPGQSYRFTWAQGGPDTYRVVSSGTGGWVLAEPATAGGGAGRRGGSTRRSPGASKRWRPDPRRPR